MRRMTDLHEPGLNTGGICNSNDDNPDMDSITRQIASTRNVSEMVSQRSGAGQNTFFVPKHIPRSSALLCQTQCVAPEHEMRLQNYTHMRIVEMITHGTEREKGGGNLENKNILNVHVWRTPQGRRKTWASLLAVVADAETVCFLNDLLLFSISLLFGLKMRRYGHLEMKDTFQTISLVGATHLRWK